MFKNRTTRNILTISLFMLISLFTFNPAQASPNLKFIGPEGGDIDAKHDSYLLVPEGALGDLTASLNALDNTIALLEDQYAYIEGLSTVIDDPSSEWMKGTVRNEARQRCNGAKNYSINARQKRINGNANGAWQDANTALTKLNNLRTYVADKFAEGGKVGVAAHDNIQARNDQIETELAFAESQLGEKLKADSFKDVITTDDAMIFAELNNALSILDSQYAYTAQLAEADDSTGEWLKPSPKRSTLGDIQTVINRTTAALDEHNGGDNQAALNKTRYALDNLDILNTHNDNRVAAGKMGAVARDNIKAYSDDIRAALELVESLHYETLTFEFGPCGTEFLIPAELVIPWDEVEYSDGLFWYSDGSEEILDLIEMDYFVDEVNETVHFFIDHFSEYYYQRR